MRAARILILPLILILLCAKVFGQQEQDTNLIMIMDDLIDRNTSSPNDAYKKEVDDFFTKAYDYYKMNNRHFISGREFPISTEKERLALSCYLTLLNLIEKKDVAPPNYQNDCILFFTTAKTYNTLVRKVKHFHVVPLRTGGTGAQPFMMVGFALSDSATNGFSLSIQRQFFDTQYANNKNLNFFDLAYYNRINKKSNWFNYFDLRANGSFSPSKGLTIDAKEFGFTSKSDRSTSLNSYQAYKLPSLQDLFLFSQTNLYGGINLFCFTGSTRPDKKEDFFISSELGLNVSFATINLNPATDLVKDKLSFINDKIDSASNQLNTGILFTPAQRQAYQDEIDRLVKAADAVSKSPIASRVHSLAGSTLNIPVVYGSISLGLGKAFYGKPGSDLKIKGAVQGYLQYLRAWAPLKAAKMLYSVADNSISTTTEYTEYLQDDLGINVAPTEEVQNLSPFAADILVLGLKGEYFFTQNFSAFVSGQFTSAIQSRQSVLFETSNSSTLSANIGLTFTILTSK